MAEEVWGQDHKANGHNDFTVRNQRVINTRVQLPLCFLPSPEPQPMELNHHHFKWVFPSK